MKCKFCQAEWDEEVTVCPVCGKDNAEEEQSAEESCAVAEDTVEETIEDTVEKTVEPVKKRKKPAKAKINSGKLAVIYIAVLAIVAVLVFFVFFGMKGNELGATAATPDVTEGTVPEDGNEDDVTCQGSYTVSDFKVKSKSDKVVATAADGTELTNAELQSLYWLQVYNAMGSSSVTADFTLPLDQQICDLTEDGWTWQQYFLETALSDWKMYHALNQAANEAAFTGATDVAAYKEEMAKALEESAVTAGYKSAEEMLKEDMGPGASLEGYMNYVAASQTGYEYYEYLAETLVPTEDQIRAYYEENKSMFDEKGIYDDGSVYVDVRHILLQPAETDEEGEYTEAAWAACEEDAKALLDQWLAGDKTEESFAALANEHSTDPGSNTAGGLYEGVRVGQMVEPFEEWCFEESRQHGDTGVVKTDYGYHIMYYVGNTPAWHYYAEVLAADRLLTDTLDGLLEKYPVEVDYSKIVLGFVDQTA